MSGNPYDPEPGGPRPPAGKPKLAFGWKLLIWSLIVIVALPIVGCALLFGACLLDAR
jgi:hypothetical protein